MNEDRVTMTYVLAKKCDVKNPRIAINGERESFRPSRKMNYYDDYLLRKYAKWCDNKWIKKD